MVYILYSASISHIMGKIAEVRALPRKFFFFGLHYSRFFFFFRYLLQYQEPIPCEQLVTALCDIKQAYTQFGGKELLTHPIVSHVELMSHCGFSVSFWCILTGKRPFGVSLLYMGWDKHYGFQLYQSDPSGNYGGWKATCIGNNSAVSLDWQLVVGSRRAACCSSPVCVNTVEV